MIALSENPPIRSEGISFPDAASQPWWIAHTKSRSEKAFAWDLLGKDIGYFLPMVQNVTVSGGRRRHGMRPLFPSYVFFQGDGEAREKALDTGRLCQVLPVVNQRQLDRELKALHIALAEGQNIDPYPFAAVGRVCRVASGRLTGLEGIVVERRNTAKIVLQITMLNRGVLLEIDPSLLEPAD